MKRTLLPLLLSVAALAALALGPAASPAAAYCDEFGIFWAMRNASGSYATATAEIDAGREFNGRTHFGTVSALRASLPPRLALPSSPSCLGRQGRRALCSCTVTPAGLSSRRLASSIRALATDGF
jgi:hypothetical protein